MYKSATIVSTVPGISSWEDFTLNQLDAQQHRIMDRFLASIERRAFHMARIATRNIDDALDIVQDAMTGLVRKYSDRPEDELKPLFYRILSSRINDWHRRSMVRNRFRAWLHPKQSHDDEIQNDIDPIQVAKDENGKDPSVHTQYSDAMEVLNISLQELPLRQQQAFMLRTLEGLSVAETASAMSCSEGSVKTHYSRAVHRLRENLGDHW